MTKEELVDAFAVQRDRAYGLSKQSSDQNQKKFWDSIGFDCNLIRDRLILGEIDRLDEAETDLCLLRDT